MVHLAVDTDIVCQHPVYDPAAAARASHHDFTVLAREIARGENGGVFVNVGSAVILPEVFLKALTVARNIYHRPKRIITANFDMISQYRPAVNVVTRPTAVWRDGIQLRRPSRNHDSPAGLGNKSAVIAPNPHARHAAHNHGDKAWHR